MTEPLSSETGCIPESLLNKSINTPNDQTETIIAANNNRGTGNDCNEDSKWSARSKNSGYQVPEIMKVEQEKPMTQPEKAGPTRYPSFCPNLSLCKLSA